MMAQLKVIQNDQAKGNLSMGILGAMEQMWSLSQSISSAMAKTMQHLSDFVTMAKITLTRKDAYLDHLISDIKLDTLSSQQKCPSTSGYTVSQTLH